MADSSGSNQIVISEIQIIPVRSDTGLVAFASCVFGGMLRLDSMGIISRADGSFRLSYPNKKLGNGQSLQFFYPISREAGEALEKAIVKKYSDLLNERISDGDYQA